MNSDYVDQWCVKVLKPTKQTQTEECPLEQPQTEEQPLETTETVSTEEILDVNSKLAVNSFVTIKLETKKSQACYFADFVCVEVLQPSQPSGVMSSAVSLPNHTFTGQA